MKNILIFSIICSFGLATILARPKSREGRAEKYLQECQEELGIDVENVKFGDWQSDELNCALACVIRKSTDAELIGSNNKATLYNVFLKVIDKAYKAGFENRKEPVTRKDLVNKVERCYATERTECEFLKCVKVINSPRDNVIQFVFDHHLQINVFDFK